MFLSELPIDSKYILKHGQLYTYVFDVSNFFKPSIETVKERLKFVRIQQVSRSFGSSVGTGTLRYYVTFVPLSDITFDRFVAWTKDNWLISSVNLIENKTIVAPTAAQEIVSTVLEPVKLLVTETAKIPGEGIKAALDPIKTVAIIAIIGFSAFYLLPVVAPMLKRISKR